MLLSVTSQAVFTIKIKIYVYYNWFGSRKVFVAADYQSHSTQTQNWSFMTQHLETHNSVCLRLVGLKWCARWWSVLKQKREGQETMRHIVQSYNNTVFIYRFLNVKSDWALLYLISHTCLFLFSVCGVDWVINTLNYIIVNLVPFLKYCVILTLATEMSSSVLS